MTLIKDEQQLLGLCQQRLPGKLALLYGGWSSEREVSLMSGAAVQQGFEAVGLPIQAIDVGRDVADVLRQNDIRHVFNMLHGPYGEDGAMGGLLAFLNIGSTGSGVLASALAMDKLRSKQLWQGIGVNTAAFADVSATGLDAETVLQQLGGKVMVKPCREGSSIGMAIADNAKALAEAIDQARQFDSSIMAEQYIAGAEFSVPIVAGEVLPIVELKPQAEFYDYEAKYFSDQTQYECPAALNDTERSQCNDLARRAYDSLGCSGWGRVDLLQTDDGGFVVLEVNTIPGMTTHSLVPMSARAHGLSFEALILNVLLDSLPVGERSND